MGWKDENGNLLGLEDFYDERDKKYFTEKYQEAVNHPLLPRKRIGQWILWRESWFLS